MPLLLNLVPALRHDRRDRSVSVDGIPFMVFGMGEEEFGIVMVETKPRMTDVRRRDASKAALSWSSKCERNLTSGPIIYEFHKNDSSRLSMSKSVASALLGTKSGHIFQAQE